MANSSAVDLKYAELWERAVALIVDNIILNIIVSVIFILNFNRILSTLFDNNIDGAIREFFVEIYFYGFIYSIVITIVLALFYTSKWQATIGKKIVGICVVDASGNKLTFCRALLRVALPVFLVLIFVILINEAQYQEQKNYDDESVRIIQEILPETYTTYRDNLSGEIYNAELMRKISSAQIYTIVYKDKNIEIDDFANDKDSLYIYYFLKEYRNLDDNNKRLIDSRIYGFGGGVLSSIISLVFICVMFFWYLIAAFTKNRTALHDIIAGTRVIKREALINE